MISKMFELQLQLSARILAAIVGCLIAAITLAESFTISDFHSGGMESAHKPPRKPPDKTKVNSHKSLWKSIIWTTATFILANLQNAKASFGGTHATFVDNGIISQDLDSSTQLFQVQLNCTNHPELITLATFKHHQFQCSDEASSWTLHQQRINHCRPGQLNECFGYSLPRLSLVQHSRELVTEEEFDLAETWLRQTPADNTIASKPAGNDMVESSADIPVSSTTQMLAGSSASSTSPATASKPADKAPTHLTPDESGFRSTTDPTSQNMPPSEGDHNSGISNYQEDNRQNNTPPAMIDLATTGLRRSQRLRGQPRPNYGQPVSYLSTFKDDTPFSLRTHPKPRLSFFSISDSEEGLDFELFQPCAPDLHRQIIPPQVCEGESFNMGSIADTKYKLNGSAGQNIVAFESSVDYRLIVKYICGKRRNSPQRQTRLASTSTAVPMPTLAPTAVPAPTLAPTPNNITSGSANGSANRSSLSHSLSGAVIKSIVVCKSILSLAPKGEPSEALLAEADRFCDASTAAPTAALTTAPTQNGSTSSSMSNNSSRSSASGRIIVVCPSVDICLLIVVYSSASKATSKPSRKPPAKNGYFDSEGGRGLAGRKPPRKLPDKKRGLFLQNYLPRESQKSLWLASRPREKHASEKQRCDDQQRERAKTRAQAIFAASSATAPVPSTALAPRTTSSASASDRDGPNVRVSALDSSGAGTSAHDGSSASASAWNSRRSSACFRDCPRACACDRDCPIVRASAHGGSGITAITHDGLSASVSAPDGSSAIANAHDEPSASASALDGPSDGDNTHDGPSDIASAHDKPSASASALDGPSDGDSADEGTGATASAHDCLSASASINNGFRADVSTRDGSSINASVQGDPSVSACGRDCPSVSVSSHDGSGASTNASTRPSLYRVDVCNFFAVTGCVQALVAFIIFFFFIASDSLSPKLSRVSVGTNFYKILLTRESLLDLLGNYT